ncbi:Cytoplasmic dynein 1 intermediate chain 2 [Cytospora mali]|uniref:Cytoplasmic dynein 1 intermediate chain 2 n=1 Tax=Cytospora mali TaxID=578113 RepID=A0A194VEK4_CYTMA|nr:Cytoplasmic dynein 1 intermediate chain 2 [Valsa mali var. pyri (nom. inval.)]
MQQRRDEILAKKAKLAELKRQRELRANQAGAGRASFSGSDLASPVPARADNRREIESLINSLVGESRPGSATTGGFASPAHRGSRPNSVLSAGETSNGAISEFTSPPGGEVPTQTVYSQPQTLTTVPLATVYECPPSPVKEIFSYSKGVQTSEDWFPAATRPRALSGESLPEDATSTPNKRMSRRERDKEEELRQKLRKEIEEELQAAKDLTAEGDVKNATLPTSSFATRTLTNDELNAIVSSDEFFDFFDRSTKVIEKALDQYDVLTDYTLGAQDLEDEDEQGNFGGKGRRKVKEIRQFYDERWSKKRMVSSIDFSPKFQELVLASYTKNPSAPHEPDGIVQVWNMNLHDRPEFVFHAQSDILTAKFSPFHPNLIVGGAYSGQVLLWDTRARSAPVQKTPLTGYGHTHPVYAIDIVGTQNANNIISCSTDGTVCGWTVDMLAQPQETLNLAAPPPNKTDYISPLSLSFPQADPTFFLVGTEEGTIFPCHRYDRAGAKAGVDPRISYKGHTGPVMSVDFHPARGPVDLGDLVLSSSLDWSVKLWKVRAPATTSSIGGVGAVGEGAVSHLMEFVREDVVYDAAWSPVKPGVFSLVDGAGWVELWDITVETEEPVARISPSPRKDSRAMLSKSLNKVKWEQQEGKRLAAGGIDGALTVFEVGPDLGGKENLKNEEWTNVKKLVNRVEAVGVNGATDVNPIRRAALRAAVSASRVPATKAQVLGFVTRISVPQVSRIVFPAAARCFSQTIRVAEEASTSNAQTSETSAGSDQEPGFGLFVRNMVFEANEDHLREAYEKYGEITKAVVARDARGLSRGYGFVWFTSEEAMEKAVAGTNASFWHGRRIQVSPRTAKISKSQNSIGPTRSLYIGNIPYETTDAELNRIFRELGNVTDVRVAVDRTTGWPRGFAHADFTDVESCQEAMNKLRGTTIGGRELRLDFATEVSKGRN